MFEIIVFDGILSFKLSLKWTYETGVRNEAAERKLLRYFPVRSGQSASDEFDIT